MESPCISGYSGFDPKWVTFFWLKFERKCFDERNNFREGFLVRRTPGHFYIVVTNWIFVSYCQLLIGVLTSVQKYYVNTHLPANVQCPIILQDKLLLDGPMDLSSEGTYTYNCPLPSVALLHGCDDVGGAPTKVSGVRVHSIILGEYVVTWKSNPERCVMNSWLHNPVVYSMVTPFIVQSLTTPLIVCSLTTPSLYNIDHALVV